MNDKHSYAPIRRVKRSCFSKKYSYKPIKKNSDTKLKVISIISVPIFLLGATSVCAASLDRKVDHANKICCFTQICSDLGLDIGWKHQLNEIKKQGLDAYYQKERTDRYYRQSLTLTVQDGYYVNEEKMIPEGYELLDKPFHGNDCYKEVEIPEAIIIEENHKQRQLLLKK